MKALFLTNEYPPNIYGGAGVHVDYLSRELARLIDVDVRCFGQQDAREGRLAVRGYGVPPGMFDAAPAQLRSPLETLQRCIGFVGDPIDADIAHCHTWYSHFGGVLAKQLYGAKLVLTTHSLEPLRPWKREQIGRGYDFSSWVEKTALELADAVIAVSQGTKADVLAHFDVPEQRIAVIPNGIDLDEYHRVEQTDLIESFGVRAERPYVLFVGRITRQKGIVHLLSAIEKLTCDADVVLCAGQPDTDEIAREMTEKVERLQRGADGGGRRVIWIQQMVSRPTAIQLYSHARVFCCPSIYEPFGIINLEAMACETPVVASAVGGIPEVVVDGETGTLVRFEQQAHAPFEPTDPDAFAAGLARAIDRLVDDDALNAKMAAAGRERVEARFSWRAVARQTVDLYQRLAPTETP